jgi:hypothetical protein
MLHRHLPGPGSPMSGRGPATFREAPVMGTGKQQPPSDPGRRQPAARGAVRPLDSLTTAEPHGIRNALRESQ